MITELETGVFQVPLFLHPSLEDERAELAKQLVNAHKRLLNFAASYHWKQHLTPGFMNRAEIYKSQEDFVNALCELLQIKEDIQLPKTVSACLEQGVFMSISPQLYAAIYPEGIEENSFEKLITHELAHRLHIRILASDEHFTDWLKDNI